MFVTRHHAKHVLDYEYLTEARVMHSVLNRVGKCNGIYIWLHYFPSFKVMRT